MRALHILAVPLLATLAIVACKDDLPTSVEREPALAIPINMDHTPAKGGVAVEVLSRSSFTDNIDATFRIKLSLATKVIHVNEPSDVVVAKVTIQPGGSLGWHTHPGPAIASVASGELTIINASDCVERLYAAGEAFVDPGQGNVHIGYSYKAVAVETVVYVTFLGVPALQSPTIDSQEHPC